MNVAKVVMDLRTVASPTVGPRDHSPERLKRCDLRERGGNTLWTICEDVATMRWDVIRTPQSGQGVTNPQNGTNGRLLMLGTTLLAKHGMPKGAGATPTGTELQ